MTDGIDMDVAGFNIDLHSPSESPKGFNEYGVRENHVDDELESIDVIYNAMEPGVRKNVEVTPEFLQRLADGASENIPVQYDHSHSQRANVGYLKEVKYSETDGFLKKMFNIPNTGSQIRSDTIADFTHSTGPQITDGSIGLDPRSLEFEKPDSDEAKAKFVDGELIEFSLTPFPGGYDNGGITDSFSKALENFASDQKGDTEQTGESQLDQNYSQVETRKSQLR